MERGIKVHKLLKSDVFSYKFQYAEWPADHSNTTTILRPYNGSIFDIRNQYWKLFEDLGNPIDDCGHSHSARFYKITYTLNLLPKIERNNFLINSKEVSLLKLCEDRTCQDL